MADFEFIHGDIFASAAEALVNPVNCQGVMGAGLALAFRWRYPKNFYEYRAICRSCDLAPGSLFVFATNSTPHYIINFPTKLRWRDPSHLWYIARGLTTLRESIARRGIGSIAIPPLGCGLGGLDWEHVKPMIVAALKHIPDLRVEIYEPHG